MASDRDSRTDGDAPPRRSPFAFVLQPKLAIPLLIVCLLLAAPFVYRQSRVAGIPDIGHPFDFEEFGTITVAAGDNALGDYRAAMALVGGLSGTEQVSYEAVRKWGWSEATDGLKAWSDRNRPALQPWKLAASRPEMVIYQPKEMNFRMLLPESQAFRDFARAAVMEAARLESEGKLDEAWEVLHALYRSSRHSGQHGCFIERLIGIAVHAMAAEGIDVWARHPDLTEAQLTRAFNAVREDFEWTAAPSTALKVEYCALVNSLDDPDLASLVGTSTTSSQAALFRVLKFVQNEPLASRLTFQQLWANLLEHIDRPRSERPAPHGGGSHGIFEDPPGSPADPRRLKSAALAEAVQKSLLAKMLTPAIDHMIVAFDRERARQDTLVVLLAVQISRRKTGDYPADLKAVVDAGIFKEVPVDIFGKTGDVIRYRKDAEAVIVWSVGDNGIDDGGNFAASPGRGGLMDIGFLVKLGDAAEAEIP